MAPKETLSLSQRLFQVQLDMLFALQKIEYMDDPWYKSYYEQTKNELHNRIVRLKNDLHSIQVKNAMQWVDKFYDLKTWISLSAVTVQEAKSHLTPLLTSGLEGDYLSLAYDVRIYLLEKALLSEKSIVRAEGHVKKLREIAKYLLEEKCTVPQVL